jgi:hypothetical protein
MNTRGSVLPMMMTDACGVDILAWAWLMLWRLPSQTCGRRRSGLVAKRSPAGVAAWRRTLGERRGRCASGGDVDHYLLLGDGNLAVMTMPDGEACDDATEPGDDGVLFDIPCGESGIIGVVTGDKWIITIIVAA